jgi:hypothetical protein
VARWTKFLFGQGTGGYEVDLQKQIYMQKADEQLTKFIEQHHEKERRSRGVINDKSKLPRRIIVTNIPIDAEEDDLALIFDEFFM